MSENYTGERVTLAQTIAEIFSAQSEVEAVALGGSVSTEHAGADSDIDLYVYATHEIPTETRSRIINARATYAEINNRFWEPGDEWKEAESGIAVDVMYRRLDWIEEQLDRVLVRYEASLGYSTAIWHNVRKS
ncbi:MAG: nucleotidyltransferase domain-containing protein, partial [Chloroflexota bacterium]|nr:nucleotidyltransferase domain-containing protein [Chloroflexota bacterium]